MSTTVISISSPIMIVSSRRRESTSMRRLLPSLQVISVAVPAYQTIWSHCRFPFTVHEKF
jgi:hypothetical protein